VLGRRVLGWRRLHSYIPNVVPALCIVYETLDFLSRRCTAATSLETEAEGVPIGMRQKSNLVFVQWQFNDMFVRDIEIN
jgi:hypothetical protein